VAVKHTLKWDIMDPLATYTAMVCGNIRSIWQVWRY